LNERIGPGSYDHKSKKILPIKDSQYYYVLDEGKLKEKIQPFNKGRSKHKPFKMDPNPAPGSYNTVSAFIRPNRRSHAKFAVNKVGKSSSKKSIGPGSYNPNPMQKAKRNGVSVLKWKTYEQRSSSIIKETDHFDGHEHKIPSRPYLTDV
jgi:hypothetical protein